MKWAVYKEYLTSVGLVSVVFSAICFLLYTVRFFPFATRPPSKAFLSLLFFVVVVSQGASMYSNIWLSDWSTAYANTTEKRDLYLGVYGALGAGQCTPSKKYLTYFKTYVKILQPRTKPLTVWESL